MAYVEWWDLNYMYAKPFYTQQRVYNIIRPTTFDSVLHIRMLTLLTWIMFWTEGLFMIWPGQTLYIRLHGTCFSRLFNIYAIPYRRACGTEHLFIFFNKKEKMLGTREIIKYIVYGWCKAHKRFFYLFQFRCYKWTSLPIVCCCGKRKWS